jgi:elongator complex protein 5
MLLTSNTDSKGQYHLRLIRNDQSTAKCRCDCFGMEQELATLATRNRQTHQSFARPEYASYNPFTGTEGLISLKGHLLVFESLNTMAATSSSQLPAVLSTLISPTTSLLALYHTDVPLPLSTSHSDPYSPAPLTLLRYLATTIISTHSISHILARKAARERSVMEPSFGLEEGVEGVLQSLGANGKEGLVLELEHRRKSGRGVREWYYLPISSRHLPGKETAILLEDHAEYRAASVKQSQSGGQEVESSTFELGLTSKQREDREGVVLPYFDAQKGGGEGGRILYDMGVEDDFDEEEDEI